LDFEVSDFIVSETMISQTVMDRTCTGSYSGQGLRDTRGLRLPETANKQIVGVAVWIDPDFITQDLDIYSEEENADGEIKANVDFCVRFGLHTPPDTPGGSQEVNYLEVIVKFDADLTDGFSIGTLTATPLDKCEKEAQQAYEVEGYFCEDGAEDTPIQDVPILNQGDFVKVCVRPVPEALDQGIRIRSLNEFTWELVENALQQTAVKNQQAAENGLTQLYCQSGYAICHFESLLFASFYQKEGTVIGKGQADLQFGGQESKTSASPKGRRALRDTETRRLQIDESPGGTAIFTMEAGVAKSDLSWITSAGVSNNSFTYTVMSHAMAAATVLLLSL
jgi:hypothetical protein